MGWVSQIEGSKSHSALPRRDPNPEPGSSSYCCWASLRCGTTPQGRVTKMGWDIPGEGLMKHCELTCPTL